MILETSAAQLRRSQLLVLSFDALLSSPREALRRLTSHFGLPVLTSMATLPDENDYERSNKVVSIKCSTRDEAAAGYRPFNERLYRALQADRSSKLAPPIEPPFPQFDVAAAVKCNHVKELTLGVAHPFSSII